MHLPLRSLLAVGSLALLAAPASALTIDNFSEGDFNVTSSSNDGFATLDEQSGISTSNVAGGVRLVRVNAGSGAPLVPTTATAVLNSGTSEQVNMTNVGLNATTTEWAYIYDGVAGGTVDNASNGTLNIDLTPFSAIQIDFTSGLGLLDGALTATLSLWTNQGAQFFEEGDPVDLSNGLNSLPLSDFTGIDLSNITSLRVTLEGPGLVDAAFNVTDISAVPEPGTALLVGLGLTGLAAAGRRRRA